MAKIVRLATSMLPVSEKWAREYMWLERIREGDYECQWHRVGDLLWSSAIRIDGVRIILSYRGAVEAAETLDARLPTKDECAAMFRVAKHVEPILVRPVTDDPKAVKVHSDTVGWHDGLVDNEGKIWIAGARAGRAALYGWQDASAPLRPNGLHLLQDCVNVYEGQHHDSHADYSSTVRLVKDCPLPDDRKSTAPSMPAIDPRPTRYGERGAEVTLWQEFLSAAGYDPGPVDGIHGPKTQAATLRWQAERDTVPNIALPFISFKQARYYRQGRIAAIRGVVIHTAEALESAGTAEALQRYALNPGNNKVSWHYAVDDDSITQSVLEEDTAFAAPGSNHDFIQIELAGYASQTRAQWHDAYSQAQLRLTAKLVANICKRYSIPVVWLDVVALRNGEKGITGHADVTLAFKRSTHTDPGAGFPRLEFLNMIKEYMR